MMDGAIPNIFNAVKGKYDLAKSVDDIFQNLQQQAKYLFAKEEDVNRLISSSHAFMRKTCECEAWLDNVKKIKQEMEDLQLRYQASQERGHTLVKYPALAKLSEEMSKKTEAIILLEDRLKPENTLMVDSCVEVVEKKIRKETNDIEAFNEIIEKLVVYLKESSIRSVGVWGMAGVGKTIVLQNLNHKVEKLGMFDIVIWITVSKECSVGRLQQMIADRIKLNVNGLSSHYHMASLISKALEKKRYLVIMDQVFSAVDLSAIGILLDTHEHGKLVLASRYRSLCLKMDLDEDIKVERMSRVDAWNLFTRIVGEVAEHPIFRLIAEQILKECGELPQLIKVVARMLRNKFNEDTWRGILHKLQSPKDHPLQPMEEVVEIFRLVYEELDDNLKKCLLYGASFPEDHEICQNYLIECWKAEEFINDACTFSNARQRGQIMLENLIERYLLDRCKYVEHVKMPIIFRNMALRFLDIGNNSLLSVRAGEKIGNTPVRFWTDARVISLTDCDLRCLPASPKTCVVTTLFLQQNEMLSQIPPSFFGSLACLRVLDLSGTGIKSLPESICTLTDLKGLYLNNCCELTVPCEHISKLKNLQLLEIFQSGLCCLPIYVGELRRLQCLKVSIMSCTCRHKHGSETRIAEIIPSNLVNKLSLLEELTIVVDPLDIRWQKVAPMIVEEVAALTMLNNLSFYFPTLECFEEFIRSSKSWKLTHSPSLNFKFRSFTFTVGPHKSNHLLKFNISRCSAKRHLKYSAGIGIPQIIKQVLKWVSVFEIVGNEGVKNLTDFGVDVLECLEICIINQCDKIENIVAPGTPMVIVLPWLKELHLSKLKRFQFIWERSIMPKSFSKLTTLTLYDCSNVKILCTDGMLSHFRELQDLRIEKCRQLTQVIESNHLTAQVLPCLKTIELIDLSSLVSICAGDLLEWPSLQRVEIIACQILVVLPFNNKNAMQLRSINCSEAWWEALVLPQEVKTQFRKICYFL